MWKTLNTSPFALDEDLDDEQFQDTRLFCIVSDEWEVLIDQPELFVVQQTRFTNLFIAWKED